MFEARQKNSFLAANALAYFLLYFCLEMNEGHPSEKWLPEQETKILKFVLLLNLVYWSARTTENKWGFFGRALSRTEELPEGNSIKAISQ